MKLTQYCKSTILFKKRKNSTENLLNSYKRAL